MERPITNEERELVLNETLEHLNQGRFKMALTVAKKTFDKMQNDHKAASYLAWAYLENGQPSDALEHADLAVQLAEENFEPYLNRAFILMRLGIFEGAISDLDIVIEQNPEAEISYAHHLKAQCLAGSGKFGEALKEIDLAINTNEVDIQNLIKVKEYYKSAASHKGTFLSRLKFKPSDLITAAEEAHKLKEYWYSLWVSKLILDDDGSFPFHQRADLLELETLFSLYRLKPAMNKAIEMREKYADDPRFIKIFEQLVEIEEQKEKAEEEDKVEKIEESEPIFKKPITIIKRTDFQKNCDAHIPAAHARMFNLGMEMQTGERIYLLQFAEAKTTYVGVEVIVFNPRYTIDNWVGEGTAVWYLNEKEVGRHNFALTFNMNWQTVSFVQSWGTDEIGFWKRGQARVDIYMTEEKICERWFLIGQNELQNFEDIDLSQASQVVSEDRVEQKKEESKPQPEGEESLESLLKNLETFTGLNSVKQAMRDFVGYLNFIKERQKLGLKTQEGLSINSVFLGNPGTGKTTVARLLGKIFKAMGLLDKGHVVETDRAGLVGQYVGETAQKTEKLISDSMGGLLFIDEAYTLVKKGGGQDFGQEAIDTLLKRMEDKAGQFAVIAAGYPDEMQGFLESNPGMKSRFTHFFNFEDYTPEEMIEIFKLMSSKEDYSVNAEAEEILKKEFTNLYRKRDKTFGNARLVRNIFNDAKMNLGKRYLKLDQSQKTKEAVTTITKEDIEILTKHADVKSFSLKIDDENLKISLEKLNALTGLTSVKREINELVKLARFYIEQGEDLRNKFSDHIVFLGNPGTGKTTVARLFSQIYSALGILPKGHLVEADRQGLVASFVGKTAEKTTELINQALGGTLFIDEAYALVKKGDGGGSDFGKEAIDTLLKRMEDDRGKFICIAAGYTDEMKDFLDSNPGMQSRFTKFLTFEDYSPDEMMLITERLLHDKKLELDTTSREKLLQHYNELYRTRDKTFGNARLVRNTVDAAARNQLLRLVDIPQSERTEETLKLIKYDDIQSIVITKKEKKQVKVEGNKELLDSYLKELNDLTGLDSVKKSVEKLISGLKVAKLREERGLKVLSKNLHAVFLGNPGTGKTTVARLISKIYKEMGLLQKGHLVEVDRSALVAGYQGQTAKKTDAVIEQALGGTLFIDEAYTLARGGNDFGQEAIDTLLKRMEDFRDNLVVIVAGYTNEMRDFLESNPGIMSRFTNYFTFEDYSPRQMLEIASVMSHQNGYKLDEGAIQLFLGVFTELYNNRDQNFGNARSVRNFLMKAIGNQEERILTLSNLSDDDLVTITYEDVQSINQSDF
jgi:SpoVK/Ycf46/Vps4 family AAA+-type ATPase